MAFSLDSYKRIVGQVEVGDLDFEAFRVQPLEPGVLRCLAYMHDIEQHTSCYLRNLLNTRAHHDPEISSFLTLWNFEEYWHGEALARVLEAHGVPAGATRVAAMRSRLGWRMSASPLAWMAFSAATKHFLAVHMTFGLINEWTTQAGYARLGAAADHPVMTELLRRIMRQEGRHIDYYQSQARERLSASRAAQHTTRVVAKTIWSPVGAKTMPAEETRHLVQFLFDNDEGRAVVARLDRRIDSLPGLDGLGLMADALATYGSRSSRRVLVH